MTAKLIMGAFTLLTQIAYSQCVLNESFESIGSYSNCMGSVDLHQNGSQLWSINEVAVHGTNFIGFHPGLQAFNGDSSTEPEEVITLNLNSAMVVGSTYDLTYNIAIGELSTGVFYWQPDEGNLPGYVQVWAGFGTCDTNTLIHTSAVIPDENAGWILESTSYTATGAFTHLTIIPLGVIPSETPYMLIDDVNMCLVSGGGSSQCDTLCGPNLAPNPGFEQTTANCGTANSEMFTDYSQVQGWYGIACQACPGNGSTPDYYNSNCSASQTNNCGGSNGSVGFFTSVELGGYLGGSNAREYVQAQLSSPLQAGVEYCVSINVKTNTGSPSYKPSDGFGIWFTDQMVDIDVQNGGQQFIGPGSMINASPQISNPPGNIIDTVCQTVSGTFVATGTEQWIVLGNFRTDANTQTSAPSCNFFSPCIGYLVVDNVSVRTSCNNTPQPPTIQLSAISDTICSGSCTDISASISGGTAPFTISWDNGLPNGAGPHSVCPNTTTIYTAIVVDSAGLSDTASIEIVVIPQDTATFNYSSSSYCITDPNPMPSGIITSGGTFTIDNGGAVNTSTGEVDLTSSGTGSYTITYATSGQCADTSSFIISVDSTLDATISPAGPFCSNDGIQSLVSANAGGVWSGNGITNSTTGTFDPGTVTDSSVVVYTIGGSCGDSDTITIYVNPSEDASFAYDTTIYCNSSQNPLPAISGTAGGIFTTSSPGIINSSTGEIDLSSAAGTYTVYYNTNGSCPSIDSSNITIESQANATISPVNSFCIYDLPAILIPTDAGGTWSGNGVDPTTGEFDPIVAGIGTWDIVYTISGACGDSDTLQITVNDAPNAVVSSDTIIQLGESIVINAQGGTNYFWSPPDGLSCTNCASPIANPSETTTYCVVVENDSGCTDTACTRITVNLECSELFIPNAFSPNGDGNNDELCVYGGCIETMQLLIFNRWGELVFETSDPDFCWDGHFKSKPLNNGVFVYRFNANMLDGRQVELKGNISLIK